MKLSRKRTLAVLAALAVALVLTAILLAMLLAPQEGSTEPGSAIGFIPEADLADEDASKAGSYRRGGIADYWDELGREEPPAPAGGEDEENGTSQDSRRPRAMAVDDIFGDYRNTRPQAPPPGRGEGSGAPPTTQAGAATPAADAAPQAESAPARPKVQVKRSGAVSSLDEDVCKDLGNGFSTLDGTDKWVDGEAGKPYRCMFTRDEKVKGGQRITVRLLEDY